MKRIFAGLAVAMSCTLALAAEVTLTDAQIDAAFAKADIDKNGTISLAESKRFRIADKHFRAANPDGDASLDKKEFAAAIAAQFKATNPDNDGTLDWKEAAKAGIKSKRTFEASNPDKDGTLDLGEYLAALVAQAK